MPRRSSLRGARSDRRHHARSARQPQQHDARAARRVRARQRRRARRRRPSARWSSPAPARCFSAGADFKSALQRGGDDLRAARAELRDVRAVPLAARRRRCRSSARSTATRSAAASGWRWSATSGSAPSRRSTARTSWRLGLAPGMAISHLLPRLVGVARASELLFTGRLVDGAEAERLGIVNRAVPPAQVMDEAMELAARHRRQRAVRGARDEGRDPARPRPGGPRGRARRSLRSGGQPGDGRRPRGHVRAAGQAQAGVHGPLKAAQGLRGCRAAAGAQSLTPCDDEL